MSKSALTSLSALLLVITIHALTDLVRQAAERTFSCDNNAVHLLKLSSKSKTMFKWHVIIKEYKFMVNIIFAKPTMHFYFFNTINNFSCYLSNQ